MKAFLLAGGRGERLRPLTDRLPKCLVPINGVPLLAIWLDFCARHRIDAALINVSRHVTVVQDFLRQGRWGLDVRLVSEPAPVGSAGTVLANRDFVLGEERFYVFYTDNLTDVSVDRLLAFHDSHSAPLTMGLFRAPQPTDAGIVEIGHDGRVHGFAEKPAHPRGDLANAGIYVARPGIFDAIPADRPIVDFGVDVFPQLIGRMYGQVLDGYLLDIGHPAALARGCREWAARARQGHRVTAAIGGEL